MGHGSWVKWVTKIGWVTWVMGHEVLTHDPSVFNCMAELIHSEPQKTWQFIFDITLANLNRFLWFYTVLIVKQFYIRL